MKEITNKVSNHFADTWRIQNNIYDDNEFSDDSVVL